MKTFAILILALLGNIYSASAQLDSTKNPVREGDPAVRQSSEEIQRDMLRDMIKVNSTEIPEAIMKVIQQPDYNGQNKTFYKSKEKEEYAVEMKKGEITSFHFFGKDGKPINKR